jgi:hypothetical protein
MYDGEKQRKKNLATLGSVLILSIAATLLKYN